MCAYMYMYMYVQRERAGARRITLADALAKLHQDADTYHTQLRDLDESRARLHALFRDLSAQETDEVKKLQVSERHARSHPITA